MRVFLSWSGETSHRVACVLKDWLPCVIQSIRPYVSSEDIDKGARWSTDIAKELHEATFGILCVTRGNIDAPWINFEAGALSKIIDKGSVAPFLFDIKRSEVQGPLLQFQSTVNEQADVYKLMASLNSAVPEGERLEEGPLKKAFSLWWLELEKSLAVITPSEERPKVNERSGKQAHSEAILEELLDLARSQQRLLRSPDELLPRGYLNEVLKESERDQSRLRDMNSFLVSRQHEMLHVISRIMKLDAMNPSEKSDQRAILMRELVHAVTKMEHTLSEFSQRDRLDRPRIATRQKELIEELERAAIAKVIK